MFMFTMRVMHDSDADSTEVSDNGHSPAVLHYSQYRQLHMS